jgi:flagellar motility protein MotE (MotC chaperone)
MNRYLYYQDKKGRYVYLIISAAITFLLATGLTAYAAKDTTGDLEKQRLELDQKEEIIKKEMERLKLLKKEVNEDIEKYTGLLKQIDKSLQKAEDLGNKRMKHVAKAYEAMQPEDAASRLSGLDRETAVQVLLMMNSKKAGLVIGNMEAKKATLLTKDIAKLKK